MQSPEFESQPPLKNFMIVNFCRYLYHYYVINIIPNFSQEIYTNNIMFGQGWPAKFETHCLVEFLTSSLVHEWIIVLKISSK